MLSRSCQRLIDRCLQLHVQGSCSWLTTTCRKAPNNKQPQQSGRPPRMIQFCGGGHTSRSFFLPGNENWVCCMETGGPRGANVHYQVSSQANKGPRFHYWNFACIWQKPDSKVIWNIFQTEPNNSVATFRKVSITLISSQFTLLWAPQPQLRVTPSLVSWHPQSDFHFPSSARRTH